MKLLFDQNLSFKLCTQLAEEFPDSNQERLLALDAADDRTIWEHAKANGFTLVTQDSDFADTAALFGPPPIVIWRRYGNQPTSVVAYLLRSPAEALRKFERDKSAACWEFY
jgi:predicted nuclease of predicted toxin-antitoxin system